MFIGISTWPESGQPIVQDAESVGRYDTGGRPAGREPVYHEPRALGVGLPESKSTHGPAVGVGDDEAVGDGVPPQPVSQSGSAANASANDRPRIRPLS
jgi:hypothetical protein